MRSKRVASWHGRNVHTRTHTRTCTHTDLLIRQTGECTCLVFPHHPWGKNHTSFACFPEMRSTLGTQQVPNNICWMSARVSPFWLPSSMCVLPTSESLWYQSLLPRPCAPHSRPPGRIWGWKETATSTWDRLLQQDVCPLAFLLVQGLLVMNSQFSFIWNGLYFPFVLCLFLFIFKIHF